MIAATMFSGIGAPEVAMPHWDWRWHAEIEKFPSAVLAARHPKSVNLGDINAEDFVARAERIGRPDVLVFGSPCQDFSVAGQRVGLDGDRGNLALVAIGIVAKLRPRWVVFENVPGLLSSRSGSGEAERSLRDRGLRGDAGIGDHASAEEDSDFAAFLSLVQQCGYFGAYRIVDAQFAGVPQRRRRVFAVFHLGDWRPAAAVLFESESLRGDHPPSREAREGVAGTISARTEGGGGLGTDFDLSGGLDESAGQPGLPLRGLPGGKQRGVVADVRMVRSGEQEQTFNNQGHGWWNGEPVAQTVRSGDDYGSGGARESTLVDDQGPQAFGGNNTKGPIEVATARNAHGGPAGRQDFESETFVVQPTSFDCKAGGKTSFSIGDQTGAQRASHGGGHSAIAFSCKDWGGVATPDQSPTLRSMEFNTSHANGGGQVAVAIPILEAGARTGKSTTDVRAGLGVAQAGDPMYTLQAGKQHAVAFQTRVARNGRGGASDIVPALNGADAGATSDMRPCVAVFKPSHFTRGKDGAPSGVSPPLGAEPDKGDQDPVLLTGTAVRRLTPRECERLQAFPDDYTLIEFRVKPASDGPRYKSLGNSMCVNDVRWVLQRIEKFENTVGLPETWKFKMKGLS